jgi:RNA polymerase sigma-70 factor (ECF subfamily)
MTRTANCQIDRDELALIADARNGDNDAMGELFRRQYEFSIAVARRILPEQEEFLDAVQSAYLSALQHFRSFRGEGSFRPWIRRIVLNHCLMRLREPRRRRAILSLDQPSPNGAPFEVAAEWPTPEELALRAERDGAVADAVSMLPKPLSDVFTRCTSGMSISDAAEELGLTVPATKTRLFRARSRLRQKLQTATTPMPAAATALQM